MYALRVLKMLGSLEPGFWYILTVLCFMWHFQLFTWAGAVWRPQISWTEELNMLQKCISQYLTVLHSSTLCSTEIFDTLRCTTLYFGVLHCLISKSTALLNTLPNWTAQHFTTLQYVLFYNTVLLVTLQYCTSQHSIALLSCLSCFVLNWTAR